MLKWVRYAFLFSGILLSFFFILYLIPLPFFDFRNCISLLGFKGLYSEEEYRKLLHEVIICLEDDPLVYYQETKRLVRLVSVLSLERDDRSKEGLFVVAIQLLREREITEAINVFKVIQDKFPDWCETYSYLGYVGFKYKVETLDESIHYLKEAIQCNPQKARYYSFLATVFRYRYKELGSKEDLEEAIKNFNKAIELDPEDINAYNNFANFLVELGEYKKAEEFYLKAIDIYPEHAKPYYNLACVKSLQGELDSAINYLKEALQREPDFRYDAKRDPDLDNLRKHPEFLKLIYNMEEQDNR